MDSDRPRYSGEEFLEATDEDDDDFAVALSCSDTSDVKSDRTDNGSLQSQGWSLTSSIFDYLYLNGRRYQNFREGFTILPNDEIEQDRLDIYHHLHLMIRSGALHLAPIASEGYKVKRILDLGTGTGIWAIDMADKYRDAEIIGVDLSPIQPSWVPPNLRFEIDDVENDWTYTRNFDFIHIRGLAGSILDWPRLIQQAYRYLKPGGYIEISEGDFRLDSDDDEKRPAELPPTSSSILGGHQRTESSPQSGVGPLISKQSNTPKRSRPRIVAEGTYTRRYSDLLVEASQLAGRDLCVVLKIKELLENTGFTNVKRTTRKLPWGAWPRDKKFRELGAWVMLVLESGLEAYAMQLFTKVMHLTPKEVMELVDGVKRELKERKVHVYSREHILYAQRPLPSSNTPIGSKQSHNPEQPEHNGPSVNPENDDDDESIVAETNGHCNQAGLLAPGFQNSGDGSSVFSERSRWSTEEK